MANMVLGFIGGDPVHRDNSRALLNDLIAAHQRNHKGSKIRFILATHPFTDTMVELADFCLTSGYQLGLVGQKDTFEQEPVKALEAAAAGNVFKLEPGISTARGLVNCIHHWAGLGEDIRLITIASDIAEDDGVYIAVEAAIEKDIAVKSLLHGLDSVTIKSDDEEEQIDMARRNDPEEEEFDEEEEDLDDDSGLDDEDYDDLDEEPDEEDEEDAEDAEPGDEEPDEEEESEDDEPEDEGDDEPEEEDLDEEEEDVEDDEPDDSDEADGDLDEEVDEEEDVEDLDEEEEPDEEEPDDEEEEEEMPAPKRKAKTGTPTRWTGAKLLAMGERDRDEFYALAKKFKVFPGRGQKLPIMVAKVLAAQDGKTPAKSTARPAAKKTAPRKTAPAAKKTTRRTAPAPTKAKTAPASPRSSASSTTRRPAVEAVGLSKRDVSAIADAVVSKLGTAIRKGLA